VDGARQKRDLSPIPVTGSVVASQFHSGLSYSVQIAHKVSSIAPLLNAPLLITCERLGTIRDPAVGPGHHGGEGAEAELLGGHSNRMDVIALLGRVLQPPRSQPLLERCKSSADPSNGGTRSEHQASELQKAAAGETRHLFWRKVVWLPRLARVCGGRRIAPS
jgi:hypothetical protein